jgi:hypothetical protein
MDPNSPRMLSYSEFDWFMNCLRFMRNKSFHDHLSYTDNRELMDVTMMEVEILVNAIKSLKEISRYRKQILRPDPKSEPYDVLDFDHE